MPDATMPAALRFMLAARRCELQGLESLSVTCQLVTHISQLVHQLQKERGFCNLYLGSQSSHYLQQLDALSAESAAVERQVHQCFMAMDTAQANTADRARLFNRIAYVLHGLDELPGLRRRIRELQPTTRQATQAFTRLIGGLLAVVFEAADTAVDPGITRLLVAMFNFMQGKELAGQERAAGVEGFSRGFFDAELQERLQQLQDGQERCFEVFSEFTESEALALWQRIHAGEAVEQVTRLRVIARRTAANARVDPGLCELWFELNTRRIDAMKEVENHLAERLLAHCRSSIAQAHADLDNHRTLLGRLAQMDAGSDQALLFSVHSSTLDSAPRDAVGNHLARSVLDLLHAQNQRLQRVSDELKETRETLNERKLIERAKKLLMHDYRLSEEDAYARLRQSAMERSMRLVDVAQSLLAFAARKAQENPHGDMSRRG
ncbi:ANTAR domain-containing protein [Pseudomonas flavescens]|uniref:ANTAR domain-containing protein n=1 Tax=Phytopseudomonas flavescens TaxID=29435 RepID=A0A1G8KQK0_9GAMM|nr:nitrate regulatory protein [Pseudomonas flavescens]SDI45751.1 ANTAR domain-containing protein [Pseudomonas flavescens]